MDGVDNRLTGGAVPPLLQADTALFVDFDGTLVELAETPDRIALAPGVVGLLGDLRKLLDQAMAVITGRRLESVDAWLGGLILAGSGLHGAQLRLPGTTQADDPCLPGLLEIAEDLRARFGSDPRILIENKGAALALHYRQAPERADECGAALNALAAAQDLNVIKGHAVIEARARGVDKGSGLKRLMATPPFHQRRPVFIGDDRTDEDAIVAAQLLGGDGIRVGDQPSAARYRLANVSAVHAWLESSRMALIEARTETPMETAR